MGARSRSSSPICGTDWKSGSLPGWARSDSGCIRTRPRWFLGYTFRKRTARGREGVRNGFLPALADTVHHNVITIPLERQTRELPNHPPIKSVVEKEIGE